MPQSINFSENFPILGCSPVYEKWGSMDLVPSGEDSPTFSDLTVLGSSNFHFYNELDWAALNTTASHKALRFSDTDLCGVSSNSWMQKPVRTWNSEDIMYWMIYVGTKQQLNYEHIDMPSFKMDGAFLSTMTETEFLARDAKYGRILYLELQQLLNSERDGCSRLTAGLSRQPMLTELPPASDNAQPPLDETTKPATVAKRRGRPPCPKKNKKQGKCKLLWEFIRDLLLDPITCPKLICWEDPEQGVFRLVSSEQVARLWGQRKSNPKMNYEKFSRAMRYYYKSQVLQAVSNRRLVYRFGPAAKGWQPSDPNFRTLNMQQAPV